MTIDDKNKDEILKIISIIIWKNDKYEYFTSEEILRFNQRQITEQAKFVYYPLGKAFQKHAENRLVL